VSATGEPQEERLFKVERPASKDFDTAFEKYREVASSAQTTERITELEHIRIYAALLAMQAKYPEVELSDDLIKDYVERVGQRPTEALGRRYAEPE
jgi:hypothetical protein